MVDFSRLMRLRQRAETVEASIQAEEIKLCKQVLRVKKIKLGEKVRVKDHVGVLAELRVWYRPATQTCKLLVGTYTHPQRGNPSEAMALLDCDVDEIKKGEE